MSLPPDARGSAPPEPHETPPEPAPGAPAGDTAEPSHRIDPTRSADRIVFVDVLRGFAVLGILLVNMGFFKMPPMAHMSRQFRFTDPLNHAVTVGIQFLAEGKFYFLFSLLFGLGLSIQMERAESRGVGFVSFFCRRLAVLLVIGAVHAVLIWPGDILMMYAVLGFPLLLFRKRKPFTLTVWTVILLLIPLGLMTLFTGLFWVFSNIPEAAAEVERAISEQAEAGQEAIRLAYERYSSSSFGTVTTQRASDLLRFWIYAPFWGPQILAYFLIGLQLGRRRFFRDLPGKARSLRRALPWLIGAGLLGNAVMVAAMTGSNTMVPSPRIWIGMVFGSFGMPALGASYAGILALLFLRPSGRRWLEPLAPVGRMALTNYLTHSVVLTLSFYGYGLGLFGRTPPWVGLLSTLAIFAVQIPLSRWWLRRFRFGPAEWLWRSLTYGRLQPFRIRASEA